jgi:hypothetical protein
LKIIICLYLFTLAWIIRDAWVLNFNFIKSRRWRKKWNLEGSSNGEVPNLLIFIPLLREQKQLLELMNHFSNLPYTGNKKIILITTEREIKENGGKWEDTTSQLVKTYIEKFNKTHSNLFRLIHCPSVISNISTQANYALSTLLQEKDFDPRKTYIGRYDADSRPSSQTFKSISDLVSKVVKKNKVMPIAIQQPSLYVKNFFNVSWYLQLEALFQTRWVHGHEIRTQINSTDKHSDWNAPYAYCVGHGMYIRMDFLEGTKGWPDPVDDVPMGFRLDFAGIPIHPLPSYDCSEVAPNFKELIKQASRWSIPCLTIWKEYKLTKKLLPVKPVRAWTILWKGALDLFSWIHYLVHFASLISLVFITKEISYLLLTLGVVYLDVGIGAWISLMEMPKFQKDVSWEYQSLSFLKKMLLVFVSPLRGVVRGISPVMGITIWFKLMKKGLNFSKTERNSSRSSSL